MNNNNNLLKQFTRYVSLNVISMIGLSLYILVDTVFIAQGMGENGLTALNLVLPVFMLLNATCQMLGMGGATKFAMETGKGNHKKANSAFNITLGIGIIFAVAFTVIGLFFTKPLTLLLGADGSVFEMAELYLRVLLLFSTAFIVNTTLTAFVRNDKNPRLSMIAMVTGSLSNIVLDYIFIFIFQWGMFGAIFATCLAPVISLCILSTHFIKKKNSFFFKPTRLKIKTVFRIFSLGTPSFITEISSGIVLLVINFTVLGIAGNTGVAAYGIVANLALIGVAVFTGISQGTQPLLSLNYGLGNKKNIRLLYIYAATVAVVLGSIFFILGAIFARNIVLWFADSSNTQLITLAATGIQLYFSAFIVTGINIVTACFFSAVNKPVKGLLLSIFRGFVFVLPIVLVLSNLFGMTGIWISVPVAELLTAVFAVIFAVSHFKKQETD